MGNSKVIKDFPGPPQLSQEPNPCEMLRNVHAGVGFGGRRRSRTGWTFLAAFLYAGTGGGGYKRPHLLFFSRPVQNSTPQIPSSPSKAQSPVTQKSEKNVAPHI
ncbi:hypothetical protein XENOCAPTIV_030937 [Xenoophorus captivus]|uniref:Uncharacterized protein n=1 Tax=Xenoophorus captivus TaxID=1517983 RepID=A0ABV0S171_9TELE